MLVLSQSQAANYIKKLQPTSNYEGCGCCYHSDYYEVKNKRILYFSTGSYQGNTFFNVFVIAKIKKARSN